MGWLYSFKDFLGTNWDKPYKYAAGAIALLTIAGLWTHTDPLGTLAGLLGWANADSWAANVRVGDAWMLSHTGVSLTLDGSELQVLEVIASLGLAACAGLADRYDNPPSRPASTFWVLAGLATYTAASPATYVWFVVGGLVLRAIVRRENPIDTVVTFAVDVGGAALIIPVTPVLLALSKSPQSTPSQASPG